MNELLNHSLKRLFREHDSFRNTTAWSMMHINICCSIWNYFLADQI